MNVKKVRKILLITLSHDGEVKQQTTLKFFLNPVVKYMPLGLLSLAANLRDHDISILDASSKGLLTDEIIEEIEKIKPDILGISAVTNRAWQMTEILKKTSSPIKVVGGPHTTLSAEAILRQGAHAVFIGDAEDNFPRWIDDGCHAGIFDGPASDLNETSLPARDLVDLDDYRVIPNDDLLFNVGSLRLPMFSSKGCPYKCIYCDVMEKSFNGKSPKKVVEEFHDIMKLGATSVHILDDCFNFKKDRVRQICDGLIRDEISIDWSVRGSVEVREKVLKSLHDAGCKRFHVGIEHLDDTILKWFKKNPRYKHVEEFCRLSDKYDIILLGYFIIGAPGETREYRENLPEQIKKLNIKIPYINVLSPLYGTEYYNELLKNGTYDRDYWLEYIENPVKDFILPSPRSDGSERELTALQEWYIELFYQQDGEKGTEKSKLKEIGSELAS